MFTEWIAFRHTTIERRTRHRLTKVLDRIHILEGRALVLLNIDEVIAIIRQADEPKAALMARFNLSDRQAEDILEIRLRQLARLEAIKIEQELVGLRDEQKKLEEILGNPATLRRLMVKEIEADAKTFADPRRTLIQAEKKVVLEVKVVDEPVTVVVSQKGWVRAQKGWVRDRLNGTAGSTGGVSSAGAPPAEYNFKAGDALYGTYECRTVDTLLAFGSNGRVYSVSVSLLPGGRGDGQPITSLIELESGTQLLYFFAGPVEASLLLSNSAGYGFTATVANMISRQKAGKAFVTVNEGEALCPPSLVANAALSVPMATHVACASAGGRILTFELSELKAMANGGRGLTLIDLEAKDTLAGAAAYTRSIRIEGIGRGGKPREETLEIRSLNNARSVRARKGKVADLGFKPIKITRLE
jgi:topoisomerase-4 subunit A